MTPLDLSKKSITFITGASRGIGRSIAVELSRHANQHSIFVLIASSAEGLDETKTMIHEVDKSLTVLVHAIDLSKPDLASYEKTITGVLSDIDTKGIELGFIFHNAATVGSLVQTTDLTNLSNWQQYYNLNLFSASLLNSVFIKKIRSVAPQLIVINVTSIAGRKPFKNMALYGSGKAARELFFKVFAIEEPNVIVLNYSPGPVDTDMYDDVVKNAQSEDVRKSFGKGRETGILTVAQTVNRMIGILEKGDFKSGDTIDYYDQV